MKRAFNAFFRALGTLIGVWLFVMLLPRWLPEDPARILAGEWATESEIRNLHHLMGLDLPWHQALIHAAQKLVRGDLGMSVRHQVPVLEMLERGFPISLRLAIFALALSAVLAWLLALWRSGHSKWIQAAAIASPVYVLGPLLLWLVAQHVPWIPVAGIQEPTGWILPSFALAVPLAGHQARILSVQLEEFRNAYGLRHWQGCGIPTGYRWLKWLLPGVSGPWFTVLGLQLGGLLGGAVLVESIFAIPGLGQLLVSALASRDLPVIQGVVLFGATLYVLTQTLVEWTQTILDPRLR